MQYIMVGAILVSMASLTVAAPSKHDAEKAADRPDKVICKRFVETGTLVGTKRVCKSKLDWERERALVRESFGLQQSCGKLGEGGSCS